MAFNISCLSDVFLKKKHGKIMKYPCMIFQIKAQNIHILMDYDNYNSIHHCCPGDIAYVEFGSFEIGN